MRPDRTPRRAAAPAETGADGQIQPGSGIENDSSAHDASECTTCRDGEQPWTEARRYEAACYAARRRAATHAPARFPARHRVTGELGHWDPEDIHDDRPFDFPLIGDITDTDRPVIER